MHRLRGVLLVMLAVCTQIVPVAGEPPQYLEKTEKARTAELKSTPWIDVIAREVPPLKSDPGDRMPMIMWHGVGFEPLEPEQIEILRERGLCQHLQLNESMIDAARALSDAGMPVILMEGRTDNWPYSLAPFGEDWAHDFDLTYQQPWFGKDDSGQWHGACPHLTKGWEVLAEKTKETLRKFRDAGVRVDAVFVDYEGDPYPWPHLFEQLRHCKRCRRELPPEIVNNKEAWRRYAWQQYVTLYDEHFAQAVLEVFPKALVTNWHVVYSTRSKPVRYFVNGVNLPPLQPQFFSATNPVGYASDAVWNQLWDPTQELTQQSVDAFYSEQITHQVSSDKANRIAVGATHVRSVPWVSRVCRIEGKRVPLMSRDQYRAALGDLWEMGIETMQIFNPIYDGYEEVSIMEVQDAVEAFDSGQ